MFGISKHFSLFSLPCSSLSSCRGGFSLIEIIVAIAIIGVMATIMVPRFTSKKGRRLDELVTAIARMTQTGYNRAVNTNKNYRIYFKFTDDDKRVELQVEEQVLLRQGFEGQAPGETRYVTAPAQYALVRVPWPESCRVKNLYIKGVDEAAKPGLKEGWFFIFPEGKSQPITINLFDEVDQEERALVVNPFTVRCHEYATFQPGL